MVIVSDEWMEHLLDLLCDVQCIPSELDGNLGSDHQKGKEEWLFGLASSAGTLMASNNSPFGEGHTLN